MTRQSLAALVLALSCACGDDVSSSRGIPAMCDIAPLLPEAMSCNRDDWTIDLNDGFIACIDMCGVGTCDPPVLIASAQSSIPDLSEDPGETSVTSRELCQLFNAGCEVVVETDGQGYADCGCD